MATYNKFQGFVGYLGTAVINCNTDQFDLYLTNNAPSASADDVKADLAGITEQNGYTEVDIVNTYAEASGTGTLSVGLASGDQVWTASGGSFGALQYAVVFDETVASPVVDPLICWHDYGSSISVNDGETFTWNSTGTLFTIA